MPIYEYLCEKCRNRFEILHRNSDNSKISCPQCKGEKVKRILSSFGFSSGGKFKSSGSKVSCSTCSTKRCDSCG